jgi:hypothetical protein
VDPSGGWNMVWKNAAPDDLVAVVFPFPRSSETPYMRILLLSSVIAIAIIVAGCAAGVGGGQVGPYFGFNGPPVATPDEPGVQTNISYTFSITNLADFNIENIQWLVYADGNTGDVVANGTINFLDSGSSTNVTTTIFWPVNPGTHDLTVVIDPNNDLGETDTAQNYATTSVTWADLDLQFSGTPTAVQTTATTDPLTISFDIDNVDTSGNGTAVSSVSYEILEGGTILATGTAGPINANTTLAVDVDLPAASIGDHTYTIIFNYDDGIIEQDVDNDSATVDFTVLPSGTT